jgi:hypothetical protein
MMRVAARLALKPLPIGKDRLNLRKENLYEGLGDILENNREGRRHLRLPRERKTVLQTTSKRGLIHPPAPGLRPSK